MQTIDWLMETLHLDLLTRVRQCRPSTGWWNPAPRLFMTTWISLKPSLEMENSLIVILNFTNIASIILRTYGSGHGGIAVLVPGLAISYAEDVSIWWRHHDSTATHAIEKHQPNWMIIKCHRNMFCFLSHVVILTKSNMYFYQKERNINVLRNLVMFPNLHDDFQINEIPKMIQNSLFSH